MDENIYNINWFPGHMARTRRIIRECLPSVDRVLERIDARIPYSSKKPDLYGIIEKKPCLTLMNKAGMADPETNSAWAKYYAAKGRKVLVCDCKSGEGIKNIRPIIESMLSDKLEKYKERGMSGRTLRAMVVGIPNVGKSTLINCLAGGRKAKAEDRPGVTTVKQWVPTSIGLDLLDMPGILWPKFNEKKVGENLAVTGAIKDEINDIEMLACVLISRLRDRWWDNLSARYRLKDAAEYAETDDYGLLSEIGKARGMLLRGGEVDTERTAGMLLNEFRNVQIGRISLERPED